CQCRPGAHAGARQLAQPGGDLLLAAATESPDPQRLSRLAGAPAEDKAVRGADQPAGQAVRLEVHQVRPLQPPAALGQERGLEFSSWRGLYCLTLHVFTEWTT